MSTVQPIRSTPLPGSRFSSEATETGAKTFTRKSSDTKATGQLDKVNPPLSPTRALAVELAAQFPNEGSYHFSYMGQQCRVRSWGSGSLSINDQGDRMVTITNGAISDSHVLQNDMVEFMNAARQAR
jgi:hypothetical protein